MTIEQENEIEKRKKLIVEKIIEIPLEKWTRLAANRYKAPVSKFRFVEVWMDGTPLIRILPVNDNVVGAKSVEFYIEAVGIAQKIREHIKKIYDHIDLEHFNKEIKKLDDILDIL